MSNYTIAVTFCHGAESKEQVIKGVKKKSFQGAREKESHSSRQSNARILILTNSHD